MRFFARGQTVMMVGRYFLVSMVTLVAVVILAETLLTVEHDEVQAERVERGDEHAQ